MLVSDTGCCAWKMMQPSPKNNLHKRFRCPHPCRVDGPASGSNAKCPPTVGFPRWAGMMVFRADPDAALLDGVHLPGQMVQIDHHACAQHTSHVRVQDAGGQQVQDVLGASCAGKRRGNAVTASLLPAASLPRTDPCTRRCTGCAFRHRRGQGPAPSR